MVHEPLDYTQHPHMHLHTASFFFHNIHSLGKFFGELASAFFAVDSFEEVVHELLVVKQMLGLETATCEQFRTAEGFGVGIESRGR
jgi:hypothetical protein